MMGMMERMLEKQQNNSFCRDYSSFTRDYESPSYQPFPPQNKQFDKLMSMMEQLLEKQERDLNYINGSGFQGNRFGNQQGNSYQRTYGSYSYQTPPAANAYKSKMEAMIEQLLEDQTKIAVDFDMKLDAMHRNLNGKFESLSTHVKKLDVQVQQTAGAIQSQNEARRDEQKLHINAVIIRDGIDLLGEEESIISDFLGEYCLSETCIDRHNSSIDRHSPDTSDETARNRLVSIDTHRASVDTERRRDQRPVTAPERVYKPSVPYPKVPKLSKQELEVANCMKMMDRKQKATIDGHIFSVEEKPEVPIGEEKMAVHSELALTSSETATALKQKAPDLLHPPKHMYKNPKLKPPNPSAVNAEKHRIPPKLRSRPDSIPSFLGRSHDPKAYTPPWMKRYSQRHSKSLLKPP